MTIDIKNLSRLSHVGLSEQEQTELQSSVASVLAYVEQISTANIENVPNSRDPLTSERLRADEAHTVGANSREIILTNFPDRLGDLLKVPPVL